MADSISRTGFRPFQVASNRELHMKSLASSQKQIPNEFFDEVVQKSTHMADLWGLSASSSRDNLGVNMMDKACGDMVKYGSEYGLITHDQVFLEGGPDRTQLFCLRDLSRSDIANVLEWGDETMSKKDVDVNPTPSVFRQPNAVFSISYKKENVLYKMFFCYVNDCTQQNKTDEIFHARNLWQQVDAMRQLNTEKIPVVTVRANFFNMKQVDGASDTDKISNFLMDMYVQHLWTLFMTLKMVRDRQGVFHTESANLYDVHVFLGQYTLRCDTRLQATLPLTDPKSYLSMLQNSPFCSKNVANLEHCQYATHYGIVNVLKVERIDVAALIRTFSNIKSTEQMFEKTNTGVCYLTDLLKLLKELRPTHLGFILDLNVDFRSQTAPTTRSYTFLENLETNWNKIILSSDYDTLKEQDASFITLIKIFSNLLDKRMKTLELQVKFSTNKVEPVSRLIQKINYELKNRKLLFTGRQNLDRPVYPTTAKKMSLKTRLCTADYGKVALDSGFESFLNDFNIPFAQHFFRSIACTNKLACQELAQQMETNRKIEEKVNKQLTSYPLTTQTEILYFLKQVLKKNEIFTEARKYEISAINEFSAFFEAVFWCSDLTPGQLLYKKIRAFERVPLFACFQQMYELGVYDGIMNAWLRDCGKTQQLVNPAYFLWKCMYVSLATNLSSDDYIAYQIDDTNGRGYIENAVVRQTQYRDRVFRDNRILQDLVMQIEFTHDACGDTCVLQALANLLKEIHNHNFDTVKMICFRGVFQINFGSQDQVNEILKIVKYTDSNMSLEYALSFANFREWIGKKITHNQVYDIEIDRDVKKTFDPDKPRQREYESLFGNEEIIYALLRDYTNVTTGDSLSDETKEALKIFVDCCIVKILCNRGGFFLDFVNLTDFDNFGSFDATDNVSISREIRKHLPMKDRTSDKLNEIVTNYVDIFKLANASVNDTKGNQLEIDQLKKGELVFKIQPVSGKQIFVGLKHLPLIEAWPAGDLLSYDSGDMSKIAEIWKDKNMRRQMNTNKDELYGPVNDNLLISLQNIIRNRPEINTLDLDKIDILRFEPELIEKLNDLDAKMMHKHLEYMSSLTHENFEGDFTSIKEKSNKIKIEISELLLRGNAGTSLPEEESRTTVKESVQYYEQRLWSIIGESGRDKYQKLVECYFSLAGCAMFYFIDVAKLFCECFFDDTSTNYVEKKLAVARARHAKVKFDSRNMILPLLRLNVYKKTQPRDFENICLQVKIKLGLALKWKILLVKSTLISTISNVLWNTQETTRENDTSTLKEKELHANSTFRKAPSDNRRLHASFFDTSASFAWTSFDEDYCMEYFNNRIRALFQLPVKSENIYIQNVKNVFDQKS